MGTTTAAPAARVSPAAYAVHCGVRPLEAGAACYYGNRSAAQAGRGEVSDEVAGDRGGQQAHADQATDENGERARYRTADQPRRRHGSGWCWCGSTPADHHARQQEQQSQQGGCAAGYPPVCLDRRRVGPVPDAVVDPALCCCGASCPRTAPRRARRTAPRVARRGRCWPGPARSRPRGRVPARRGSASGCAGRGSHRRPPPPARCPGRSRRWRRSAGRPRRRAPPPRRPSSARVPWIPGRIDVRPPAQVPHHGVAGRARLRRRLETAGRRRRDRPDQAVRLRYPRPRRVGEGSHQPPKTGVAARDHDGWYSVSRRSRRCSRGAPPHRHCAVTRADSVYSLERGGPQAGHAQGYCRYRWGARSPPATWTIRSHRRPALPLPSRPATTLPCSVNVKKLCAHRAVFVVIAGYSPPCS